MILKFGMIYIHSLHCTGHKSSIHLLQKTKYANFVAIARDMLKSLRGKSCHKEDYSLSYSQFKLEINKFDRANKTLFKYGIIINMASNTA